MTGIFYLLIGVVPIWALLVVVDKSWEAKKLQVETSRKIIHMATGTYIAFWPLFVPWTYIQILSLALIGVISLSYTFNIFRSIHEVDRLTSGELMYPVAIAVCAFLEPAAWMFTAAILHLAIADSIAAIVGTKWGKKNQYKIFNHKKSVAGSVAFFATSFAILLSTTFFVAPGNLPNEVYLLAAIPLALTALENISFYGADNLTVPLAAIVLLTALPT